MTNQEIKETFEDYFEKYKKTEGDESSYSAVWSSRSSKGTFEINLTKCPAGTIFKIFADKKKLPEIHGWDNFLDAIPDLEKEYSGLFDANAFFSEMKEMI